MSKGEIKYYAFFEQASDAILIIDENLNIIDVNISMCKLSGYTRKELLQMRIPDLFDPDTLIKDPPRIDLILKGEHIIRERTYRKKDGSLIEIESNVKLIEPNRIMAIIRDITNIKKAQRQIALSESTLRSAFEYSAIGMALVSPEGKYLKVNNELCRMLGYNEQELLSLTFGEITHPDDLSNDLLFVQKALKGELEIYRAEKRYFHKNGSIMWVNLNVSLVKDTGEKPLYFVAQIEDITEKKRVSEELKNRERLLSLFIEHSPAPLAMLDKDMRYITVSSRWLTDYNLEGLDIIGKSHYEVFPTIPQRWKDVHQRCLEGVIEKCDEDSFTREDGTIDWLKWEVRPWRKSSGEIGGIIMLTEVITKVKEAELKFRNLVEKSMVGVYIIQNGKFAYVNPRFAEIFGYSPEELINTVLVEEVVYEEDRNTVRNNIHSRIKGEVESIHYEARGQKRDGTIIWTDIYDSATLYKGTRAIIGTLQDITERKIAEKAIKDSEEKYRYLFNNNPACIMIWDLEELKLLEINQQVIDLYGYSKEEFSNMSVFQYRPEEDREKMREFSKRMLSGDENKFRGTWRHLKKNGKLMYMDITSHLIDYNGHKAILSLGKDVTEQLKAEEKLKKSYEDIRQLNAHLQTIREEERTSIAREIHDELGQQLTCLKMDILWFTKKIQLKDDNLKQKHAEITALIDETIKTVRRIASDLRPALLDDLGLVAALEWQSEEFQRRTGIECKFECKVADNGFEKNIVTGIFRIYQESLTNVMRHAHATIVETSLKKNNSDIILVIKDNGKGFKTETVKLKKTLGLLGMTERAHMFGGKLNIESKPGEGTTVTLIVSAPVQIPEVSG